MPLLVLRGPKGAADWLQQVAACAQRAAACVCDVHRQDTGGHGATWPIMAFLLVLQPTYEATLQKGVMRLCATALGVGLAWGLYSVSSSPAWIIPISTVAVFPSFWLIADSRTKFGMELAGDIQ